MDMIIIVWKGLDPYFADGNPHAYCGCDTKVNAPYCYFVPLIFPNMLAMNLLVKDGRSTQPFHIGSLVNISRYNNQRGGNLSLPYKDFLSINKVKKLTRHYHVQPYAFGTDKRSLAMIISYELFKSLIIGPLTILFLLKVAIHNELHLKIIRQDDLERKDTEKISAAVVANNQEANNQ